MLRFGLKNVRRLEDMPPVAIKPITLLLGRNSGGKSTFLRTFPLFRQSIMTRISSPILWYGDLVDFGSFDTTLSRDATGKEISFTFVVDEAVVGDRIVYFGDELEFITRRPEPYRIREITYVVGIERRQERNRIATLQVSAQDPPTSISIKVDENNVVTELNVDGTELIKFLQVTRISISPGSLFPEIRFTRPRDEAKRELWSSSPAATVYPTLAKLLRRLIDNRTKDKTVNSIAARLLTMGYPNDDKIVSMGGAAGTAVRRVFENLVREKNGRDYMEIRSLLLAATVPGIVRSVAVQLKSILGATLYIGPARARSERYYRYQDLSVSEIDPDGKNFPMFLNSLSRLQIDRFSKWVSSLFGYGVSVSRQTGHISLNLTDGDVETNIVDVGYGVSQILPVLGQIWWARERPLSPENKNVLALLAIEQPELHLHPAHQALLADALVGEATSASQNSARMHYLVETHSETLVNRLGELIANGKLASGDVQVVLFEPDEHSSKTNVRTVNFDDSGALIDWPFGFFQPAASTP